MTLACDVGDGSVVITFLVALFAEPASSALFGTGLAGLLAFDRRHRRRR